MRIYAQKKSELHDMVMTRTIDGRNLGLAHFDNMQEVVSMYESLPDDHDAVDLKRQYDNDDTFIFGNKTAYGRSKKVAPLRTIEGVVNVAKTGNCQNVFTKYVTQYRDKINAESIHDLQDSVQSIKRVTRFTDDGAELDIDRVMCGDTEYWRTTRRDGQYRVVRLVINFAMSGDNKADSFAKLLAMTYVTAEILDAKGYGLEIYGMFNCHTNSMKKPYLNEQCIMIPLKKAQEGLDIERIGVVGIVGFFRHVTWIIANNLFGYFNGNARKVTDAMRAFSGADILIENTWIRGDETRQVMNISKALESLERGC